MEKICAVSGKKFEITDADQVVYARLGLPTPTRCPDERNRRRMAWRNDRVFYRRKCSKSGKPIISIYSPDAKFPVYESSVWWGDTWNGHEFGKDFDFSRPFFDQWQELMQVVPRRALDLIHCENSEYSNYCGDDKNCYLDIAGEANEDCYFNLFTKYSKNCTDNTFVYKSELMYESIQCHGCFDCRWSMYLESCNGCDFCFDCKSCSDCIFCWNLRQKKNCIFNEQLTPEEFEKRKAELRTDSREHVEFYRKKFEEMRRDSAVHKNMQILNSENCTGNHINNSKNTHHAWNVSGCEDSAYLYDVLDATDCRDLNYSLYKPELSVELISTLQMTHSICCMGSHFSHALAYCDHCENSHDLFGCIGIKHGAYCILNRQYSREEYEKMLPRVIAHLKLTGEWGEFFPAKISPHGYNETVAHEYSPIDITAPGVKKNGALYSPPGLDFAVRWQEIPERESGKKGAPLPDKLADTPADVCDHVQTCEATGRPFRFIPQEIEFYKKMNVALPRRCPDARHARRHEMRPPRALFTRPCAECGMVVPSVFAPDRTERVLCEKCLVAHVR